MDDLEIAAPRGTQLLARYAEAVFWLARYLERIENLARILDVTDTFVRSGNDERGWRSVVQINADEKAFFERHEKATAQSVVGFYVLDRANSTSIVSSIGYARENARTLRPLISTEMWSQINVFYNKLRALTAEDIAPSRLSSLCAMLKEACQAHAGITEGTFYRDQAWSFYQIGKNLERADQVTRLVDIKYHTLLPSAAVVGSAVDVSQWNAVLRAAAGYHAFRRVYPRGMTPGGVAGFLLLNEAFPRSLVLCVRQIEWHLGQLRTGYRLRGADAALERLDELRGLLAETTIEKMIATGLHEFIDFVQQELIRFGSDLAEGLWGVRSASQSQTQTAA